MIKRDYYLKKLIQKKDNGMVKIITGIRRCGKSYLLFNLYYNYLLSLGINENQIIKIQLDDIKQLKYRNPFALYEYIESMLRNNGKTNFYLFIDEVQYIKKTKNSNGEYEAGIYEVLNGANSYPNLDVYVTGSNSKMLSSDIATEFRGRGDEIRIHPLSYSEYYNHLERANEKINAYKNYSRFGGMPYLLSLTSEIEKKEYLDNLVNKVYIQDILERNNIKKSNDILGDLIDVISSSTGSLTSYTKLANTFNSIKKTNLSHSTIANYLEYFVDSFLITKVKRYDISGKAYIDSPNKYYFEDIGLRNARLGFKGGDEPHIMENIIYNELSARGYIVNIGVVNNFENINNKTIRKNLEIDFIAEKNGKKCYIQSAYAINNDNKRNQELRGFDKINDSFKKIMIIKDDILPWYDEKGILYMGLENFLLNENSIDEY